MSASNAELVKNNSARILGIKRYQYIVSGTLPQCCSQGNEELWGDTLEALTLPMLGACALVAAALHPPHGLGGLWRHT